MDGDDLFIGTDGMERATWPPIAVSFEWPGGERYVRLERREMDDELYGVSILQRLYGQWQREQREREVISRLQQNSELQRQLAASRAEKEAGGTPVPWRQVLAETEARRGTPPADSDRSSLTR